MIRHNTPAFIRLQCILIIAGLTFLLLSTSVYAGEFGATFNSRLSCKQSSWHEGKVVGINGWFITVDVLKDLLRHTKTKRFRIRNYHYKNLKRGSIVLINFHKEHPSPATPNCAGSLINAPPLMGIIDPVKKDVQSLTSFVYSSRMLTWFYHTKRWDARVVYIPSKKSKFSGWYAKLPNGKKYLFYDEADPKRLIQY